MAQGHLRYIRISTLHRKELQPSSLSLFFTPSSQMPLVHFLNKRGENGKKRC